MHPLTDALMDDPIIAAVKNEESLAAALESERETIFLLSSTLLNVHDIVARIHAAGKRAIVHIDLVEGLSSRTIAVDALVAACGPDGIISTHPNLIRHAHTLGLLTIQRAFVLDSLSLDALFSQQSLCQPDFIEVLPGIMPPIITEISQKTQTPLIAGGLIRTKQDVLSAMNAGAAAVSTSARSVWKL